MEVTFTSLRSDTNISTVFKIQTQISCCELSVLVVLEVTSLSEAYGQSVKVTSPPFSSKFLDAITSY